MIGPWYDPIEERWHQPKPPLLICESSLYESEEDKGRRAARENAIWDALKATALATQQESST